MEIPKETTPRDKKYLAWIRTLDCCECGYPGYLGETQAHHVITGGASIRCSDYLTVPLCSPNARGCHIKSDKGGRNAERYRPIAEKLYEKYLLTNRN